jgi:hypothetical protein
MPVSVALSMLTPAALMKERPLPPHSRLFEVRCFLDFLVLVILRYLENRHHDTESMIIRLICPLKCCQPGMCADWTPTPAAWWTGT